MEVDPPVLVIPTRYPDCAIETQACTATAAAAEPKKGKKVDPFAPLVADPNSIPPPDDVEVNEVMLQS